MAEIVEILKFFLMEHKNTFIILHDKYHGCWWPGDKMSQGIRSLVWPSYMGICRFQQKGKKSV